MVKYWFVLLAIAGQAGAVDAGAAIRATFVKAWIEAVRSGDEAKVQHVFHPKVLACSNGQTREYFDLLIAAELKYRSRGDYRITKIAPVKGQEPMSLLPSDGFSYPVQPAYEIDIDFDTTTVVRYLAESNGSWYEVQPCPNEKGMAYIHEQIAKGQEQGQRAARLLAELKDPLRGELLALLKQGRRVAAVNKYQAATGEDVTTAVMVMDLLYPR